VGDDGAGNSTDSSQPSSAADIPLAVAAEVVGVDGAVDDDAAATHDAPPRRSLARVMRRLRASGTAFFRASADW
jgi:hypothetical protein